MNDKFLQAIDKLDWSASGCPDKAKRDLDAEFESIEREGHKKFEWIRAVAVPYGRDEFGKLGWENPMAQARLHLLVRLAKIWDDKHNRKDPEAFDERRDITLQQGPQGFAVLKNCLGYFEWRIYGGYESAVVHTKPAPHMDFLFGELRYVVPASKRQAVQTITDSQYVYPLDRIAAGCHFPGATIATLSLMIEVAEDRISASDAQSRYASRIMELAEEQMKLDGMMNRGRAFSMLEIESVLRKTLAYNEYVVEHSHNPGTHYRDKKK